METSACNRCTGHVVTVLGRLGFEARIICTGCRSRVTVPIAHLTAHELATAITMREVKALQRQHATAHAATRASNPTALNAPATPTPHTCSDTHTGAGTVAVAPAVLGGMRSRFAARLANRVSQSVTDPEVPATLG